MSLAKLRLRHPKGVATLELDLEGSSVQDLQQQISKTTEILPSQQELKSGYPPHSLTLIPELPVSSLGLKAGDQIIVTQKAGVARPEPSQSTQTAATTTNQPQTQLENLGAVQSRSSSGSGGPEYAETDAGFLVHRVVPDDNSCLFSSVALVFEQDISRASEIRRIVAEVIRSDPETWSEAMLGHPREQYIQTILKPSSWGGAIELSILASRYGTEIASIDVETGRIDRFEPSSGPASNRCILVYSGIHYDAASLSPILEAPSDFHQTVFSIVGEDEKSDPVLLAAKKLADKLRGKRAFTNTATFDIRCEICKQGLKGEKQAREHASATGHTSFGEY